MVRKKTKIFPERRRSKNASTTSRDGSESAASEEPPGVAGMESPLPASPQAPRPGTPEKAGPTQLHCKKLQGLAHLIEVLSVSIETSQKILQGSIDRGFTDPTDGISFPGTQQLKTAKSDTPFKLNSPDPSPPPTPIPTKRKDNSEGFTSPPSRKLTKSTLSNSNTDLNFKINLTNTFSALDNTATEAPIETPVTTHKSLENSPRKTNQSIQSPKLPPPIVLLITDDLRSHTKTLVGKMPALRMKTAGKYVKLYTDTQPQHDTLKQLLEVLKYPFYTFTPKHERPIKVVLKGLPRSTTTAEIKSDLLDLGYTINKVTQLTGNITKQLLPVFTISLPRNTFNEDIFHLKTLGYLSITVEGFESRGVIQCFQCNQFNHTAEHCHLTPKCLKCGEKHQTRDCQIKRLDTPFCVNCQVHGHMANYSKCPLFPKPRKGTNIKSNPLISNNFIRPNISYAQVTQQTIHSDTTLQMAPLVTAPIDTPTSKEIPTLTTVPTQIPNTQTDCLNLITQTLQQTIHALSTLVQHISQLTSPQSVSVQSTPGPNKSTSKTPLTKSQIIAQINNLLNHYDGASD
ncbi:nucleic-acid-binding protein from transposon X-element [Trichonephila clavipes]|nr:nucleic-acid-binding protein from transposon X-element [Trichonephila clavipes]